MRFLFGVKKVFISLPVFLVAFVVISLSADISFLQRKTTSFRGEAGWDGMADFKVFWKAGKIMSFKIFSPDRGSSSERPLYDKQEPFYHFRYSPVTAVFMSPFGSIPYPRAAMLLWQVLGNGFFLAAMMMMAFHAKKTFALDDKSMMLALWVMFLGTLRYYFVVICQGQIDCFAAFILVLIFISYMGKKDFLCGILFAALLQIKPFFAPLGLLFLIDKRYKLVLSVFAAMAAFLVLPAVFVGAKETLELTKDWFFMLRTSGPSQVLNYKNQSIAYGAATLISKVRDASEIVSLKEMVLYFSGFFIAMAFLGFFFTKKYLQKKGDMLYGYIAICVITAISVIFSPISWEAYYLFLIIPLSFFCALAENLSRRREAAFYLAGYFILTLSTGTDITKILPVLEGVRFINVSLGTLLLYCGIFRFYSRATYSMHTGKPVPSLPLS